MAVIGDHFTGRAHQVRAIRKGRSISRAAPHSRASSHAATR
jgi:hypothetical protein